MEKITRKEIDLVLKDLTKYRIVKRKYEDREVFIVQKEKIPFFKNSFTKNWIEESFLTMKVEFEDFSLITKTEFNTLQEARNFVQEKLRDEYSFKINNIVLKEEILEYCSFNIPLKEYTDGNGY